MFEPQVLQWCPIIFKPPVFKSVHLWLEQSSQFHLWVQTTLNSPKNGEKWDDESWGNKAKLWYRRPCKVPSTPIAIVVVIVVAIVVVDVIIFSTPGSPIMAHLFWRWRWWLLSGQVMVKQAQAKYLPPQLQWTFSLWADHSDGNVIKHRALP